MILITVAGTYGKKRGADEWWRDGSPWRNTAMDKGFLMPPGDRNRWSTTLDGLWGPNDSWTDGGRILARFIEENIEVPYSIVAHSHGGQVACNAIGILPADRKPVNLVTVATPVRKDCRPGYLSVYFSTVRWTHIYGGWRDYIQLAGSFTDGYLGFRRKMVLANENIKKSRNNHSNLMWVETWDQDDFWALLRDD